MPIVGLTERLRIPRLGKLRLGVKAVNAQGVAYPKAVDHFVLDADKFPEFATEFRKVYGDQPKAIEIAFPTDHEEDWASQYYRAYSRTRGLVCKGDGITANRMVGVGDKQQRIASAELKDTEWVDLACPGRECSYYAAKQCRELMMLQFLLPNISGLGIWQLDTSSINSILNINSAVALLKNVLGKVALLPLTLRVVPVEVSPEGKKKTVYVLQLDIPVKLTELGRQLLLPAAEDEIPELLYPTPDEEAARDAAEQTRPEPKPAPKPAAPVSDAPKRVPREDVMERYNALCKRAADMTATGVKVSWGFLDENASTGEIVAAGKALAERIRVAQENMQPAEATA